MKYRNRHFIPKDIIQEILIKYLNGQNAKLLANNYEIAYGTLLKILHDNNVKINVGGTHGNDPHNKTNEIIAAKVAERYANGEALESIAKDYGINRVTVRMIAKRYGKIISHSRFKSKSLKQCSICNDYKPAAMFQQDKTAADYHKSYCLHCYMINKESIDSVKKQKHAAMEGKRRKRNPLTTLLCGAKSRSKSKNLEFNITIDDIILPEYCPVLGICLEYNNNLKRKDTSPSLDRIDSTKGYIKGNVRIISWRANRLKSDATLKEMESIIQYMKEEYTDGNDYSI